MTPPVPRTGSKSPTPKTQARRHRLFFPDECVVAVGSISPPKIEATQISFQKVWPEEDWQVVHANSFTGTDGITIGGGETQSQARTRAQFALATFPDASYGVGIESGLFRANKCWFECTWVVVHDRNGTEGMASSPAIEIPKNVSLRLQRGEPLGDICNELFGGEYTNDDDGYFGAMTNNGINRIAAYTGGIMPALAKFVHPEVFEDEAGS